MSNTTKKYASLITLQNFLDNLKNLFATKASVEDLSSEVAYIDATDNENITDVNTPLTSSDIVDNLESTSVTRPLSANQGKILNEKIEGLEQSVQTAEVGQTIIVKEVDASGKPTKWESAEYQPRTHYEEGSFETLCDCVYEQKRLGAFFDIDVFELTLGKKYTVTLDGVSYQAETFLDENGDSCLGAPYNIETQECDFSEFPFSICCYDGVSEISTNVVGSHACVVVDGVVHRLDEKYLPLLTSPNGTKYLLSVADDGTLTAIEAT